MKSLLQKAVRRGHTKTVNSVLQYFIQNDETHQNRWLRNRLAVITTEECWPYLNEVTYDNSVNTIAHHYTQLALAVKDKNAAGLGSLALALKNKEYFVPSDTEIVDVATLLHNPGSVWENPGRSRLSFQAQIMISKAEEAYRKSTHDYDKATAVAAAYLATTQPTCPVEYFTEGSSNEFPIWTAFDRHTPYGAEAIVEAAKSIGVDMSIAQWLAFYQDGSKCTNLAPSPWWDRYLECRYYLHGMSAMEAQSIWNRLAPIVQEIVQSRVQMIKNVLARHEQVEEVQYSLF